MFRAQQGDTVVLESASWWRHGFTCRDRDGFAAALRQAGKAAGATLPLAAHCSSKLEAQRPN
jgi:hypothetical protein